MEFKKEIVEIFEDEAKSDFNLKSFNMTEISLKKTIAKGKFENSDSDTVVRVKYSLEALIAILYGRLIETGQVTNEELPYDSFLEYYGAGFTLDEMVRAEKRKKELEGEEKVNF
jgi:hypothetical protein